MFASAATLLGLASLWMLERSLDKIEYHDMQERADDVRVVLSHQGQVQNTQQLRDVLAIIYEFKDDGKYLQVRDEHGNWIYRSRRMLSQNPDLPTPDLLPKAGLVVDFHHGTHFVRTLEYPIAAEGIRYSVQTGIALDKNLSLLNSFRFNLLLLTPAVLLLATVGGHFMSRKALKPVATLATETRRITDRNLDIRLPVSNANDEISDLSQTLNQMLERIDNAFTSVRTFTGNASHELRTPISLLRTEIEVALYRNREPDEYRAILVQLHEEAVNIMSLVEDLLSLARADGGAETVALAPIRVEALFGRLENVWARAMDKAMLDFRVEMPEHDDVVLGDLRSVQRLLSILLENASKFTPPGGSVTLSAATEAKQMVLSVQDTGVGIALEHQPRIFERFYRVPTSGPVTAGSGLGLSLAKWIAERHGSQLDVESAAGLGSVFSFSLEKVDIALKSIDSSGVSQARREFQLELELLAGP
jgi:signal transduction histidine kinase